MENHWNKTSETSILFSQLRSRMGEMKASARGPDGSAFSGGGVGTSTVSNWSTVFVQWDANRNERHKTHANGPHADKTRATIPDKSKDVNMLRRFRQQPSASVCTVQLQDSVRRLRQQLLEFFFCIQIYSNWDSANGAVDLTLEWIFALLTGFSLCRSLTILWSAICRSLTSHLPSLRKRSMTWLSLDVLLMPDDPLTGDPSSCGLAGLRSADVSRASCL